MKRSVFFIYGLACYALFFGVYAYMASFVGNFFVPRSIDSPVRLSTFEAALINLALLSLFAVQHSVMARPGFKALWTRIIPQPIERSTYMLASCLALMLFMWQWQPIGGTLWNLGHPTARGGAWALFAAGWLMVPAVSLMISHFDLFGMRQVWLHLRGRPYEPLPFHTPALYRHVRHPLYIGWAIAFWATPTMTIGHALFASVMCGYMAVATVFEERDLIEAFGRHYLEYRERVPRFVPRFFGGKAERAPETVTTS